MLVRKKKVVSIRWTQGEIKMNKMCYVPCSVAMRKHHDQGNLQKMINLAYDFRELESMMVEQMHKGRKAKSSLLGKQETEQMGERWRLLKFQACLL